MVDPTLVTVIMDMGGVRVLKSMKYATTERMYKNGLVRVSGDNTVSHIVGAGNAPVLITSATTDQPFGICLNDKEVGLNDDGLDMVDVLVFGRRDTLIGYTAPVGGMAVSTAYGPGFCVVAAAEGATAELMV